ncbi:hypothetical protein [Streptomyces sp. ST2-7A]|nr:hypothetical protein [Streptomyces sp. ST2-7A]MCE7079559.1 hypothetical protein [Streptomyces sp. ST2-7A]
MIRTLLPARSTPPSGGWRACLAEPGIPPAALVRGTDGAPRWSAGTVAP